ncbi:MAG: respiratory nitrate reductase subunit gamma [Deltaproteobacteria bacterium]|nr:respiratory nitrate reductase subunit gamma [Deltaproteobacteria bacterium]
MVDFITGPMVWISCLFFLVGTIYQVYSIKKLTRKVQKADKKKVVPEKTDFITKDSLSFKIRMLKYSFVGIHREKIALSILFHMLIIFTPLLVPAHNILLKQSFGFSLLSLPESLIDLTTILVILCFVVFLLRRIFVERVRAISSFSDYAILIIAAAPFVTGFLSCQQFFDPRTIYLIHILTGEIMLIALPLTKLVHMVFFFFGPLISIHKQTFGNGKEILRSEG